MEANKLDPRLHFVTATAIIVKDGKFLIAKRAAHEKAFPNKWTVPGGKLVRHEYENLPHDTEYFQYYNIMDWLVRKEVREEVGVEIENVKYLTDLLFIRPDGFPVVTLSYWAVYKSGEVKLCKDLSEYAWVTAKEAEGYDLIEGITEEIEWVNKLLIA
ncbi:MAG: NUDIX domain-containing protein [Patescibacteria group bacterium]|nr:NUDIX domain-containing protein [Patescibacteria group bacterium]MDE2015800.1 NUDIX domain-containing protein [Patescibacteria group bacterium]MDE2227175.1 NUDIX domain-containing protein [Patescibacteria group bacterium]